MDSELLLGFGGIAIATLCVLLGLVLVRTSRMEDRIERLSEGHAALERQLAVPAAAVLSAGKRIESSLHALKNAQLTHQAALLASVTPLSRSISSVEAKLDALVRDDKPPADSPLAHWTYEEYSLLWKHPERRIEIRLKNSAQRSLAIGVESAVTIFEIAKTGSDPASVPTVRKLAEIGLSLSDLPARLSALGLALAVDPHLLLACIVPALNYLQRRAVNRPMGQLLRNVDFLVEAHGIEHDAHLKTAWNQSRQIVRRGKAGSVNDLRRISAGVRHVRSMLQDELAFRVSESTRLLTVARGSRDEWLEEMEFLRRHVSRIYLSIHLDYYLMVATREAAEFGLSGAPGEAAGLLALVNVFSETVATLVRKQRKIEPARQLHRIKLRLKTSANLLRLIGKISTEQITFDPQKTPKGISK